MATDVSRLMLREEPYDGPSAQSLIDAVQQEYVVRYGGPDDSPVQPAEFAPPHGRFVVGYVGNLPVACGGIRAAQPRDDGSACVEIKRMYVAPSMRGHGLARVVLARLEDLARAQGASYIILETGLAQPEAIRLYETSGFERIEGFGHYSCSPSSLSFGKRL